MRKDEQIVREAIERRLSVLEPSALRRARIRQRIEREEEPIMKKKMTIGMAFALVAVLALSGVAVAAGVSLFEMYGRNEERIAGLAEQAALETQRPEMLESGQLGTSVAAITEAYYDGLSLTAGYSIENAGRLVRYMPTEEEMEGAYLQNVEDITGGLDPEWNIIYIWLQPTNEEEEAIVSEFKEAMKKGEPYGAALFTVAADGTQTDDGVYIPISSEDDHCSESGTAYVLCEYEYPLPEAVRNRDSLTFGIDLMQETTYLRFDGEKLYVKAIREEAGQMQATVQRAAGEMVAYTGAGEIEGVSVQATAQMSASRGVVAMSAESNIFERKIDEYSSTKHRVYAEDGEGRLLSMDRGTLAEDGCGVTWVFFGSGADELPEEISIWMIDSDKFFSYEQIKAEGDRIVLKKAE